MSDPSHDNHQKVSAAALMIALGIIYGDIGTSPLYVMSAIARTGPLSADVVYGGISLIFWTLTIMTSIKYVMLTLQADNNGEGGIFSLYSLVRKPKKWLLIPAIIGGAALIADGMITPPISVCSAIETLELRYGDLPTAEIAMVIISLLFAMQRFGTQAVGKLFGPIMFIWFAMLAILGINQIVQSPEILTALSPHHAVRLLVEHRLQGIALLGAVFLCTTGAEALYSDLGHCGKENIRVSWVFVKICLILNYLGQGVYLIKCVPDGKYMNPFAAIMPEWWVVPGGIIATMAAVIASQALITGSYTLFSEAIRLDIFPKVTVEYPTKMKGQIYIPVVNVILWLGCIGVVLYFQTAEHMEAAYGLAITITMLMTTILMTNWLVKQRTHKFLVWSFLIFYLLVEGCFFFANSTRFMHGGWVTVLLGGILFLIMYSFLTAKRIKSQFTQDKKIKDYLDQLITLSNDEDIPKYATNLVFMSSAKKETKVEEKVLYSILQNQPKRAEVYWFVHIEVTDQPNTMQYKVTHLAENDVIKINFRLGFRVQQRIGLFFRKVVADLVEAEEVNLKTKYHSSQKVLQGGDFRFVLIEEFFSKENDLPFYQEILLRFYTTFKGLTASPQKWFGLDSDSVTVEKVPLRKDTVRSVELERIL
jgi:KUP system potassium uptake protein